MPETRADGPPGALSPTEAMIWYAEATRRFFHPWFGALVLFERDPGKVAVDSAVSAALGRLPRLSHAVATTNFNVGLPSWHEVDKVDLRYHVRHLQLDHSADLDKALEALGLVVSLPMDRGRPLWECYLLGPFAGGRAACFFKLHGALIDSIAVADLVAALATPTRPDTREEDTGSRDRASRIYSGARDTWRVAQDLLRASAKAFLHPFDAVESVVRGARELPEAVSDAAESFTREFTGSQITVPVRRLDILTLPVGDLEAVARPLGVEIDDLLIGSVTTLLQSLKPPHARRIADASCLTRINCSAPERYSFGTLPLPVGERRSGRRLALVRAARKALADSSRASLTPWLVQAAGWLPRLPRGWLAGAGLGHPVAFFADAGVVEKTTKLANGAVEAIYALGDFAEAGTLGVTTVRRGSLCHVGITADSDLVTRHLSLPGMLTAAIDDMASLADRFVRGGHRYTGGVSTDADY